MKNVLLFVTGGTPQVITETLYGLMVQAKDDKKFIPDEVIIQSTSYGIGKAQEMINTGHLQALIDEYELPQHLNNPTFITFKEESGEPIEDLKTPYFIDIGADQMSALVKKLTTDNDVRLHLSIAGGRKTMSYYAGYAMSLYGRQWDKLSHVIVEKEYERTPEFYYPTKDSHIVHDRNGNAVADAHDAQVWLAEIPFVRLRQAIKDKHQLKSDDSFIEVVNKINESFNDVYITINVYDKTIVVNDKFTVSNLPAREFAFLHWFADLRKKERDGVIAPSKKSTSINMQYISELTDEYITYYEIHKFSEKSEKVIEDLVVSRNFFDESKSKLKSVLINALGLELASNIEITNNERRGKPFYLNINPDNITIYGADKNPTNRQSNLWLK